MTHKFFRAGKASKNMFLAITVLILGLILTVTVTLILGKDLEKESKKEFHFICSEIQNKIDSRLHAHSQLLYSGSALFAASDLVTRADWKTFCDKVHITKDLPGIQGLGFSIIIPHDSLAKHTSKIRKEGFSAYKVQPDGDRSLYTSIIYLEPFSGRNLKAFGYDMFSESVRRKAMETARDSAIAVLSEKVTLIQETDTNLQAGTLMYVPVYKKGAAVKTLEQRRAAIIGWVYSPHRMTDLMEGVMGNWNYLYNRNIRLKIYDSGNISPKTLLYDSQQNNLPEEASSSQSMVAPIIFNGSRWTLVFTQTGNITAFFQSKVLIVLTGGSLISILLFFITLNFLNTQIKGQEIARQLTSEIKKGEERFSTILNSSAEGIYGIGPDGNCIFANKACFQILGYENAEQLLGRNMHEMIHHKHADGTILDAENCKIYRALHSGIGTHCDNEVFWRADGSCFPAEYWSYPLMDDGKTVGAVVTFFDISKRKRSESVMANMAMRTETLLKTASDGIHVLDEKGNIIEANPAFCNMLGYTQTELSKLNIRDWDIKWAKEDLELNLHRLIETTLVFETRYLRKDKSTIDVEINGTGITLNGKKYVYASARDITARKKAEEEIMQTRINYETFFNTIDDFLFVLDVDGNIIHTNNTVLNRLGYTAEELKGRSVITVHPQERREEAARIVGEMLTGKIEFCPVPIITKKGMQIPVETRVSRGYWNGKPVIFGVTKDITQIRLSEEKFSKLFYINPSACALTDLDTQEFIEVNDEFNNLLGFEKDEVIGKTSTELGLMTPEIRLSIFQKSDENGNIHNAEVDLRTKTGELKHTLLSAENIYIQEKRYRFTVINDISKRKLAEKELYESNKKLEAIIFASPDGIGMAELDGRLQLVSVKLAEMFGFISSKLEDFAGKTLFDFIAPEYHSTLTDNIKKLFSKNKDIGITEYVAVGKAGNKFYIDVNSTIMLDHQGNPENILFIIRDISERKQVEEALKSKTSLLEAQTNATIDAILVVGEHQQRIMINQRMKELFEVPQHIMDNNEDTLLLLHIKEMNKYPDQFYEKVTYLYNNPEIVSRDEIELRNGLVLDRYTAPVLGPDGKYYGRIWSFRDITEQKRAQEKLNMASARLQLATQAGGVGIWDYDLTNNTLLWDDQMFALYGITQENFDGAYNAWLKGLHPDDVDREREEVQMAISGEKDFDTEFKVVWPDGSVHNIRAMAIVQRDETGKALHMIGTNWDITEQKRAEEALLKAKQEADIANKAKSEFLANMSHEIRTPMNAILGFSEALYHKLSSEQQKKMIKSVLSSGNLLMSLLNDILDLSKIEAGKLDISFQPVNLSNIIDEIIILFKDKAQSKELSLLSNVYPGFPGTVMLDEIRIKQILFNLVGNAIKFTHKGYVKINLKYSPVEGSKGTVSIEVEDTGIGIEQSQKELIFEAFRQQAGQSNRKYGGTGLGLAISKRLTEKMNGRISVVSSYCAGSAFTVTFPEVEVSFDNIQKAKYLTEVPNITFEEATIMIVDDVLLNIETIENLLSSSGLQIVSADSGEAALEKLKHITPALILLDMRMSGIDGYEVAKIIKENPKKKHIPIIAFTASVLSSKKIENSSEFNGYLYKPVTRADLYRMLSRFLKHSPMAPSGDDAKKKTITKADIPSDMVPKLPQIIEKLKQKMPKWENIKDSFVLFNIESFAHELKDIAIEYKFSYLENYANLIKENLENIDLESLRSSLLEFPEIINNIEELCRCA